MVGSDGQLSVVIRYEVDSGEWEEEMAEKWCLLVFLGWVVVDSDG